MSSGNDDERNDALAPNPEIEARIARAVVMDNRLDYIMAEVQDALDNAAVKVHLEVEAEAAKGALSAHFAVAKWYELLAVRTLRRNLQKQLKGRTAVGPRRN